MPQVDLTNVQDELMRCQQDQIAGWSTEAAALEEQARASQRAARVLRNRATAARKRCLGAIGEAHGVAIPDGASYADNPPRLVW